MANRREFLKRTAAAGVVAAAFRPVAGVSQAAGVQPGRAGMAQTVLGPLDASKLGFTLAHEHIADAPDVLNRWPKAWGGRTEFVVKAVEQLKAVRAAGISTIVDLTPYDV